MDGTIIVSLIAGVAGLGGVIFTFIRGRGENRNKSEEIKNAIDDRIDKRMDSQLKNAFSEIDDLKRRLDVVEDSERATRSQNVRIKDAVKRWFHSLATWDIAGRQGLMPMPSIDELELLELEDPHLNQEK